ncbi:MAG: nucleotidyltransferase family protein [Methanosphaera sp.]|nr:nucleotidyltransferase family protein [Methanosphaera sp.]
MVVDEAFIEANLLRDRDQFCSDLELSPLEVVGCRNTTEIIADFTEYSPLHNGHLYCMNRAKELHPDALFVAIVPGLFDRNGRGLPYILTRQKRVQLAISVGADIVVEGPPMGIMGSGQYSLCLALMFRALNADYIPRGYISDDPKFKIILDYINNGKAVAPKPYKIVSMEDKKVLLEGKLHNDDYVIVSLSKSLSKINFDFKNKFIFIPRLEGVSGTQIRQKVASNDFTDLDKALPEQTISLLQEEINSNHAPLDNIRVNKRILSTVNESSYEQLSQLALLDEDTINNFINNRPFETVDEVVNNITYGFSKHRKNRILSVLETCIFKDEVYKYIDNYPQIIRILGYKNEDVLKKFKINIKNNLKGDHEIICQ